MSEVSAPATLTTQAPYVVEFNVGSGTDWVITEITGLDQAPVRTTIEQIPRGDGGIWHPAPRDGRQITVAGYLEPAGDAADRNDACDLLIQALDDMLGADPATWAWTPSGSTERSIEVFCQIPVVFSGGFRKEFIFGLYAPDPTITIAAP